MSTKMNQKLVKMVKTNRKIFDETLSQLDIKLKEESEALEKTKEESFKYIEDLESVKTNSKKVSVRFFSYYVSNITVLI